MIIWSAFLLLIFLLLALDLGVFNKKSHVVSFKEALGWTALWVSLALLFSFAVYYLYQKGMVDNPENLTPKNAVIKYLTGYLVEQSLSMDNIFVIAVIFTYFQVPGQYQHRVLFWGILGALFFRGVMIFVGVILLEKFAWMMYVFGGFLIYSAVKMLGSHDNVSIDNNPAIKILRRVFPVSKDYDQDKFFVRKEGLLMATPLFVALLIVETTDIMFAFDSIPAIFAITRDPFLVFTSNIFAIMGLRSLYFVLAAIIDRFKYLKYSLVAILFFVGLKMIAHDWIHLPEWASLTFIIVSLGLGIGISLFTTRGKD
jgi:tellurite resistance protein TerC